MNNENPIVGHKTYHNVDGTHRHEPLRQDEADKMMAQWETTKKRRTELMPTEEDAARMMCEAYHRLKELGWNDTCYGPTDVIVRLITPGSSGIHTGNRWHPWPEKTWWIDGEWPSNPCLFKPLEAKP